MYLNGLSKSTISFILRSNLVIILMIVVAQSVTAQKEIYRPERDELPYYFGITLGYNSSSLHATKNPHFLQNDSVLVSEPGSSGGIALGLLGSLRLNEHFQLRFNPTLILGGARYFTYTLGDTVVGEPAVQKRTLPNTTFSFPLHLKFNSDRIQNFRTYVLAGVKYDLNTNGKSANQTTQGVIKLKNTDFGLEAGVGFNFYMKYVTVSPEIKFSYGLSDIHDRDSNLKYSSVFDKLQTRMVIFSLHIED